MISIREQNNYFRDGVRIIGYTCDAEADVAYLPTAAAVGNTDRGVGSELARCSPGSYAIVLEPSAGSQKKRILNNANLWKELPADGGGSSADDATYLISLTEGAGTTLAVELHRVAWVIPLTGCDAFEDGDRASRGTVLKITCTPASGSIANVTVNGAALTLTAGVGYYTIDTEDVVIASCATITIVPWATGTDEEIAAMLDAAKAGTIDLQTEGNWAVGDVRTISIGAFTGGGDVAHAAQSIDVAISSFDDYNACGAVMQFDFKDELATGQRMNATNTNVGGYGATEMYVTTLPALVNALPAWLKDRLLEFSVLASAGNLSDTIETVTGNKLALRSEVEIIGAALNSKAGEGTQVPYYATSANRIKKCGHSGSANNWWGRSPYKSNGANFCNANTVGATGNYLASLAYGLAPFGCI